VENTYAYRAFAGDISRKVASWKLSVDGRIILKWIIIYIINQQDAAVAVLCLLKTTIMLYMFWTRFASHFGHGIVQCSPTFTFIQDLFQPNS